MLALNRNPSQNQFLIDVSHKITTFAVPNLTLGPHMDPKIDDVGVHMGPKKGQNFTKKRFVVFMLLHEHRQLFAQLQVQKECSI